MSASYSGVSANSPGQTVTVTNPTDGDALTAASNNVAIEVLANFLQRAVTSLLEAKASTWFQLSAYTPADAKDFHALSQALMVVGGTGTTPSCYVRDAVGNWTNRSSGLPAQTINGVAYQASSSRYVVVGTGNVIYTSTNSGGTWTSRTSALAAQTLNDVKYSSSLGLFICTGESGGIQTSPDGITWTARTNPIGSSQCKKIAMNADGSIILIGNQPATFGGQAVQVLRSTDGTTWSAVTITSSTYDAAAVNGPIKPRWVQYSPTAGIFLVGYNLAGAATDHAARSVTGAGSSWTTATQDFNIEVGDGWQGYGLGCNSYDGYTNANTTLPGPVLQGSSSWIMRTDDRGRVYVVGSSGDVNVSLDLRLF